MKCKGFYYMIHYGTFFLFLFSFFLSTAQRIEKIKGNRILEVKSTQVADYRILEIGDDFEVLLVAQETPKVRIETDSNLHEFITVDLTSEKLSIKATKPFSRYKRLYVEIGYTKNLAQILVNGEVEVRCNTALVTERTALVANENAKVDLHFQSDRVEIYGDGKTEITTSIEADSAALEAQGNAQINAGLTLESVSLQLKQKSDVQLSGTTRKSSVFLIDDAYLNASQFTAGMTDLRAANTSKVYINTTDKLTLNVTDSSKTYLLSNPLIEITSFTDEAQLIKTNSPPSSTLGRLLR